MSITATYVRCRNGAYFKNPVWCGVEGDRWWYVCFDDDDPPELVVSGACCPALAATILGHLNTPFRLFDTLTGRSKRCFPQSGWSFAMMRDAQSYFFEFEEAPPVPFTPPAPTPDAEVAGTIYPYGGRVPG